MSLLSIINKLKPITGIYTLNLRYLCSSLACYEKNDLKTEVTRPKKVPIPKITLIAQDNVTITTLEEAKKLSKRRDLKLVKLNDLDTKTQRPIYKMMTGVEYHQEDLKQREARKLEKLNDTSVKGEKLLILTSKISEHDLNTQINKIAKWINKRYEVRVVINSDSTSLEKAEKIYSTLENSSKDIGRFVQKRQKGNDVKFQIIPNKKDDVQKDNKERSS